MKKNSYEKLFVIIIAIVAVVCIILSYSMFAKKSDTISQDIIIYYGNQEITEANGQKIDINKDMTFTIGDVDFGYNIIEIKDKKVRIIEADCPEQVCVKHGELRADIDNDMIICAPHRIIIKYEK